MCPPDERRRERRRERGGERDRQRERDRERARGMGSKKNKTKKKRNSNASPLVEVRTGRRRSPEGRVRSLKVHGGGSLAAGHAVDSSDEHEDDVDEEQSLRDYLENAMNGDSEEGEDEEGDEGDVTRTMTSFASIDICEYSSDEGMRIYSYSLPVLAVSGRLHVMSSWLRRQAGVSQYACARARTCFRACTPYNTRMQGSAMTASRAAAAGARASGGRTASRRTILMSIARELMSMDGSSAQMPAHPVFRAMLTTMTGLKMLGELAERTPSGSRRACSGP